MSWIKIINDSEWTDELADLRPKCCDPHTNRVDNILAVHSLDVGSLRTHLDLYLQAMTGTDSMPKVDREMIAVIVSKENNCHY